MRSNDTIGALLNASFGNATELIVSIFALQHGLYDVIKSSLVGSILGNMMLVLGCSFLVVGLRKPNIHGQANFNSRASQYYCSLLLLACMGMIIPTVMFMAYPDHEKVVGAPVWVPSGATWALTSPRGALLPSPVSPSPPLCFH